MPYKDPDQQREYMRQWVAGRRAEWFKDKVCELCGNWENLELDHIDPSKKVSHSIWSWSAQRRETELVKCRVLCNECHKKKSAGEHPAGEHNGMAKLTEGDIRAIRSSELPHRTIARMYPVDESTIRAIRKRQIWGSVV